MSGTNYYDTFIAVAEDCPAKVGQVPPAAERLSVARMQYDLLAANPYRYTSDDLVFTVFADRADIPAAQRPARRDEFFAKGQPCLRASPLGKRYGWGFHHDSQGRVALYPRESAEYAQLRADTALTQVGAMRSSRRG